MADSRTVALNHTAGLSTPVQAQMVMFSLFSLMDEPQAYKAAMKRIVLRRKEALYRELALPMPVDPNSVSYYHLLDLEDIATQMYGAEFAEWVVKRMKPNEALFRIAQESGVVLLPGRGFGGTTRRGGCRWPTSTNTTTPTSASRGAALAAEYFARFEQQAGGAKAAKPKPPRKGKK